MKKERVHTLTITVRFNKPCTARFARREVRNCIHGEFYCGYDYSEDAPPEVFKVRRIGHMPKGSQPCKP